MEQRRRVDDRLSHCRRRPTAILDGDDKFRGVGRGQLPGTNRWSNIDSADLLPAGHAALGGEDDDYAGIQTASSRAANRKGQVAPGRRHAGNGPGASARAGDDVHFDDALTARLDEIIDSGLLFVVNSESAVSSGVQALGCENYDEVKHRELVERNRETGILVDHLMQSALRGKRLETGKVTRLVAQYLGDMTEDVNGVLASIVETVIQRSIASHCVNVALLAMGIGIEMGLDATNVRNLGLAALVHDWGMAGVAPEIAEANRRLTEDKFYEIKKHPITSLRLLEKLPKVPSVVPLIVYQVHERPNGNGYPRGRTGERIHPLAKIISVADAYQALISPRPFRPPLMRYAAMECILRQARTGDLDAEVVRAF